MERRKFIRFDAKMDVEYRMRTNTEVEGITSTSNLSKEGVGMAINRKLNLGTELEMKLQVPGDAMPIFAQGRVAWCRKLQEEDFGVGVRLTRMDSFDRGRLLEHAYGQWLNLMDRVK